jgi:hypothetical protein
MMRKYMFGFLTLFLVAALAFIVIRSNKMEKLKEKPPNEAIQEEKLSPTRVLTPRELKIVHAEMAPFKQPPDKAASQSAQHEIMIRNLGPTAYSGIQLLFEYLNPKGKTIATKPHFVNKPLSPGGELRLSDIKNDNLPVSISDCRVIIISADIAEAP